MWLFPVGSSTEFYLLTLFAPFVPFCGYSVFSDLCALFAAIELRSTSPACVHIVTPHVDARAKTLGPCFSDRDFSRGFGSQPCTNPDSTFHHPWNCRKPFEQPQTSITPKLHYSGFELGRHFHGEVNFQATFTAASLPQLHLASTASRFVSAACCYVGRHAWGACAERDLARPGFRRLRYRC